MSKILLINPPDQKMIQGAVPRELGRDRMGKYPPLGLLYLASSTLAHHPNLNIRILDAIADSLTENDLMAAIEEMQPDIVGISVYSFTMVDGVDVARIAKRVAPNCQVVFGGFHPSIYPEETLRCSPDIDVAVAGEAEETFPLLVEQLLNRQPPVGIPGVSVKLANGNLHVDHGMPFVQNLDALPFPDRRMVSYLKHRCILGSQGLTTNILATRGCPYKCKYCYVNIKNYRIRSLDNLMAEIHDCISLGIEEFFFVDDLFNIHRKHVLAFSERILQEGVKIRWNFRGRVNQIDEEVLAKARQAGCTRVHFGVESGNPQVLKRIAKGTNLESIRRALALTRQAGIEVSSNIMIGLPGESPRETEETIRFALSLETDYIQAAVFTPYPDTPLYKEGLESGLLPHDYWRDFALHPKADFEPLIWSEFYTKEQLFDQLRTLYRRFYMRPRFVLSYLKKIRSWADFWQLVKNFLTFLMLITAFESRRKTS
ncbi:MAG: radical SAM protein [Magnetococcales bacterium]|nr:radical SAM protein [Magnetococcales bacterium]NGZ04997.1 radical SAM protein [Magnetococcales bacterium]